MSGVVPQVCVLFGPSAAGGAYIPAFCDVVIMRDGNASMYLGSPRMAEMVIGEKVSLEEMGGAQMHTGVSGCGHFLVKSDEEGIDLAKRYLSYFPTNWQRASRRPRRRPSRRRRADPRDGPRGREQAVRHARAHRRARRRGLVPRGPQALGQGARSSATRGSTAASSGIVANQPKQRGGVLFVDSSDKAARFIWTCNAFNVPLLFLADVPGFMIGTQVERQGIIRHGAKMVSAVSRGHRAEDLGDRAQGLRRRPVRDGRAGVRARRVHRAAVREDRGDGPAGGDQRRLLQPDPGDRGRDERARRIEELRASTPRRSTCCTWRRSSWWMR